MANAGSIEPSAPEMTGITVAGNIGFIGIDAGYSYLNDTPFNQATDITSGLIEGMAGSS